MRNGANSNFTWNTIYEEVISEYAHGKLRPELIEWGREYLKREVRLTGAPSEDLNDDEVLKWIKENLDIEIFLRGEAELRFFSDPRAEYKDPLLAFVRRK